MNENDLDGVNSRYCALAIRRLAEETVILRERLMELFNQRLCELKRLQIERYGGSLVELVTTHPEQFDREMDELYNRAFRSIHYYATNNEAFLK